MSVCLSVTFVAPMSLIISTFVCLSFVFVCQYILLIQLNVRLSFCCMFVYTCPFARLFVRRYSVDTTQHIRIFYRATHMHSADYVVVTCLSDHSSLCLSDSPSVCHTTGLPPCTGRKNTDIYGINCPYIMFTAMCPYVCLPILYVPFVHFNLLNCVVTHVSLIARPPSCLFVFCV